MPKGWSIHKIKGFLGQFAYKAEALAVGIGLLKRAERLLVAVAQRLVTKQTFSETIATPNAPFIP
jgi:hypothetical protein